MFGSVWLLRLSGVLFAAVLVASGMSFFGANPQVASASRIISQIGLDIDGEAAGDDSGYSVSLSSDGSRVAIGAIGNDGTGSGAGHVRVYDFNGASWVQVGSDIDGEAAGDRSGYSVSLSSDGSRVAIGAPFNNGTGADAGHVRVYDFDGSTWTQVGGDIDGEAAGDLSGHSVSLSSDGSRVAIGARNNDGTGTSAGHVRVYDFNGASWVQVGSDIDGEAAGYFSGYSVSLSSDGSRVAIGAVNNGVTGSNAGLVRVYGFDGSTWTQVGGDIDGEAAGDNSGESVSLSSDGSRVAIGAPLNDGTGADAGHVRVYDFNGASWVQVGTDIDGEAAGDNSGQSVSLSSDGSRVAIGAPFNNGTGADAGHARAWEISPIAVSASEVSLGIPGIFLYIAASPGRLVEGTPVYHGSASIAPNTSYTLSVQSMGARALTRTVLATGVTNGRGHVEGRIQLGALAPGSYKIVMTGSHPLGYPLVLTNHIVVDAAGKFVSVSPESQQPFLN